MVLKYVTVTNIDLKSPLSRLLSGLYLLYINDLPLATSFFTSLFADDTSYFKSSPDIASLIPDASTELKKAAKWFQENRLSLNVSKTKYKVFRNRNMHFNPNSCNISIGNEILERIGNDCVNKYRVSHET